MTRRALRFILPLGLLVIGAALAAACSDASPPPPPPPQGGMQDGLLQIYGPPFETVDVPEDVVIDWTRVRTAEADVSQSLADRLGALTPTTNHVFTGGEDWPRLRAYYDSVLVGWDYDETQRSDTETVGVWTASDDAVAVLHVATGDSTSVAVVLRPEAR